MSSNEQFKLIKPAIVGINGYALSPEEIDLFTKYNPLGYILFTRNYQNKEQLKSLIEQLKNVSGRDDILVLIDQEGERVYRLKQPDFTVLKNAVEYSHNAHLDLDNVVLQLKQDFEQVGRELKEVGINVNCAPVADLYYEQADKIISVRSYGSDPIIVAKLCEAVDEGLARAGVQSIIKHIPGHGRAMVDSHKALPVVNTSLEVLTETDFKVFSTLNHCKMAMAAHIVYEALDPLLPVTLSKTAVSYIREVIGFTGLLITDALEMKALSGEPGDLAKHSIEAGFDIVLYCEPDLSAIHSVLSNISYLSLDTLLKIMKINAFSI